MALFQLIAHEYRKYVLTRGFLLFLLIVPVSAAFGFGAAILNEVAAPIRAIAVIDQTGLYEEEIDRQISYTHDRKMLRNWDGFAGGMAAATGETADLPYPFDPEDDPTPQRVRDFIAAGGLDAANALVEERFPPGTPPVEEPRRTLVRVPPPADIPLSAPLPQISDALRPYLNGDALMEGEREELFAAVLIPAGFGPDGEDAQFWTQNLADTEATEIVRRALNEALQQRAFEEAGLPLDAVRAAQAIRAPLDTFKSDSAGEEAVGAAEFAALFIPLGLAYVLFIMIMSVGGMLLTSTVEEKSNKIVEVLLSSVSATELMAGKLIGLALVGVTAPAIFLALGFSATTLFGGADEAVTAIGQVLFGSPLVPLFFFYFLIGYVLFASIYLAVGAMSESIQDAQSFVGPLTIVLILPLPFLQMVVQDPNGIAARIMTWVPIYTPYAVMMRINNDPPLWEIAGATALLLAFTGTVLFFMGRIYRNGVLKSGGAPKLKDALALAKSR